MTAKRHEGRMSEKVFLQRRGVSKTLSAGVGALHIEFFAWQASGLHVAEVVETVPGKTLDRPDTCRVLWKSEAPAPLEKLLREVERRFGIEFDVRTEAYCYEPRSSWETWPHIKGDIFRTCAVYEKGTDTIRHARTNVCFVKWDNGVEGYDLDAAAAPYRAICERAVAEFKKSHNQRNSDEENKAWLAWLIGEWIKDELHELAVVLPAMTR